MGATSKGGRNIPGAASLSTTVPRQQALPRKGAHPGFSGGPPNRQDSEAANKQRSQGLLGVRHFVEPSCALPARPASSAAQPSDGLLGGMVEGPGGSANFAGSVGHHDPNVARRIVLEPGALPCPPRERQEAPKMTFKSDGSSLACRIGTSPALSTRRADETSRSSRGLRSLRGATGPHPFGPGQALLFFWLP
jgi:hypothetical protein